jgi:hypothetical protein
MRTGASAAQNVPLRFSIMQLLCIKKIIIFNNRVPPAPKSIAPRSSQMPDDNAVPILTCIIDNEALLARSTCKYTFSSSLGWL